jgi:hypothetical protein
MRKSELWKLRGEFFIDTRWKPFLYLLGRAFDVLRQRMMLYGQQEIEDGSNPGRMLQVTALTWYPQSDAPYPTDGAGYGIGLNEEAVLEAARQLVENPIKDIEVFEGKVLVIRCSDINESVQEAGRYICDALGLEHGVWFADEMNLTIELIDELIAYLQGKKEASREEV